MEILALLIPALIGLVSGIITNRTNRLNVESTNQANTEINQAQMAHEDEAAEAADQRTRALYNDIESPSARRKALMDAGLSPALMYGQGGNGGTLAQGAQAQTQGLIPQMPFQMQQLFDVSQMVNASKATAEIQKTVAETQSIRKDLPLKDKMKEEMEANILKIRQDITESMEKVNLMFAQRQNEYKQGGKIEAEKQLSEAQKSYTEALAAWTNIKANDQRAIDEATIKEMEAKTAQAFALAKKAGVETKLLEETMQSAIDKAYAEAQMAIYDWTFLKPAEFQRLQADAQKLRIANDKEKALSEIYGSWKGHARAQEIKDWLKLLAGLGGAAGVVANAAKTLAK